MPPHHKVAEVLPRSVGLQFMQQELTVRHTAIEACNLDAERESPVTHGPRCRAERWAATPHVTAVHPGSAGHTWFGSRFTNMLNMLVRAPEGKARALAGLAHHHRATKWDSATPPSLSQPTPKQKRSTSPPPPRIPHTTGHRPTDLWPQAVIGEPYDGPVRHPEAPRHLPGGPRGRLPPAH